MYNALVCNRRGFIAGCVAACVAAGWSTRGWASEAAPEEAAVAAYEPAATVYPLTVSMVDGDGTEFEQTFEAAPQTAITMTDSAAEILCRLGLADRVVGTVTPEAAMPADIADVYATIEQLGDKKTLSREVVVGMGPEIVIGRAMTFTAEGQTDAATYNDLGIELYIQQATAAQGNPTLQGVIDDVATIAEIFDVQEDAAPLVNDLQERLATIEERVAAEATGDPQSVLIMTNFKDGTFGTFGGATGASLQFNIIEMMGAELASTESASGLTFENLIQFDPDVILYVTADRNKETDALVLDTLYSEESLASVPAIANERVVEIAYADFMDASPRVFDAAETILDVLYPEA